MIVESISHKEYENHACTRVELTDKDLTWYPNSDVYEDEERSMIGYKG